MASALSVDLRERVVAAIEAGVSRREAARRFAVSPASAVRWRGAFVRAGRTQAVTRHDRVRGDLVGLQVVEDDGVPGSQHRDEAIGDVAAEAGAVRRGIDETERA